MNTGSRDEQQMLRDIHRIAKALERIAAAVESLAAMPPAVRRNYATDRDPGS